MLEHPLTDQELDREAQPDQHIRQRPRVQGPPCHWREHGQGRADHRVGHEEPAPRHCHPQDGVGQAAEVISHLLNAELAFHVARQGAEELGVMGAAQ